MCLYTRMICPQRARKDIICYKVVRKRKYGTGKEKYETPCMKEAIRLHSTMEAKESTIMPKKDYSTTLCFCHKNINIYIVEEGYVHCITSIEDAKMWIIRNNRFFPHNRWAIIECVIPKGVLYYKSVDHKQICAKQIFTRGIELQG